MLSHLARADISCLWLKWATRAARQLEHSSRGSRGYQVTGYNGQCEGNFQLFHPWKRASVRVCSIAVSASLKTQSTGEEQETRRADEVGRLVSCRGSLVHFLLGRWLAGWLAGPPVGPSAGWLPCLSHLPSQSTPVGHAQRPTRGLPLCEADHCSSPDSH